MFITFIMHEAHRAPDGGIGARALAERVVAGVHADARATGPLTIRTMAEPPVLLAGPW